MNILDYTTYSEIRALLGVAIEELEDTELAQPILATQLELDLDDVHAMLTTWFVNTSAITNPSAPLSKFLRVTKLYASYCVAARVCERLAMFAPIQVTDGKAEQRRADYYAEMLDNLNMSKSQVLAKLKLAIIDAGFSANFLTESVSTFIASTGLAVNPVTNAAT